MTLKEFWSTNKTWIIVLLIFVGAYFVFKPVGTFTTSQSSFYQNDIANSKMAVGGAGFASGYNPSPIPPISGSSQYYPPDQRKIEKSASADLEVDPKLYETAKLSLDGISTKYNGYYTAKTESKETYGDKDYLVYQITLKVPVDSFESAVADIKNVADVKNLNVNADDMTTQYYDTKSYLDNYKKEKDTLLALYSKALQIDDIIKLEQRISEVQSQIDSYTMQLNNIDRVTQYSTISVTLSEKKDIIQGYYQMTGLKQLWGNVQQSFDNVFVIISNVIGFVVAILIVWLGYKVVTRIKRGKQGRK